MNASPPNLESPEILPTHTPALFAEAVRRAAERLREGEPVVLPTETVYGLAANALDPAAVARIYALKGRPAHNPLIVHLASGDLARRCVTEWPDAATRLAEAFWPGPLTLVLARSREIPDIVCAGGPTVGLRWPSHPLMQAVIRACGFPLAAPSANLANQLSPTQAGHVVAGLGGRVRLVVDGGPCSIGIESTVVDLTQTPARILRPGMVSAPALAAVLGAVTETTAGGSGGGIARSPGQLPLHYAPRARLEVWHWTSDAELQERLRASGVPGPDIHLLVHDRIPNVPVAGSIQVIPHEPEAYARAMYDVWHQCDAQGARLIAVEAVPAAPEWQGIMDRLQRAAGPRS